MTQQAAQMQALQDSHTQSQQDLQQLNSEMQMIRKLLEAQLKLGPGQKRNTEKRDRNADDNSEPKKHRHAKDSSNE